MFFSKTQGQLVDGQLSTEPRGAGWAVEVKRESRVDLGGCPRMPFFLNSSLFMKNNARNINYMTVLVF